MMQCTKCGAELGEGAQFCPSCGAQADGSIKNDATVVTDPQSGAVDVNKVMGVLSYLGVLSLIPYFTKGLSAVNRDHALRGVNLFLLELIGYVGTAIIGAILTILGSILGWLVSVAALILSIIGIINVCNEENKDLPYIGSLRLIKK